MPEGRTIALLRLGSLLTIIAALAAPLSAQQLLAGTAQVVITPPMGMPMAGYYSPRASTGVHDDLYAKALVLRQSKVSIALVVCDVITSPPRSLPKHGG